MIGHGAHVPVDGCLILGTFRMAEANPKHHIARSSSSMCDGSRSVDIQPLPSWSSQNRRRFLVELLKSFVNPFSIRTSSFFGVIALEWDPPLRDDSHIVPCCAGYSHAASASAPIADQSDEHLQCQPESVSFLPRCIPTPSVVVLQLGHTCHWLQ